MTTIYTGIDRLNERQLCAEMKEKTKWRRKRLIIN